MKVTTIMIWLNTLLEHFSAHPVQFTSLLAIIAFSKSTIFLSSFLPPTSITLLTSISVGLLIIPTWIIWLAITVGAMAGSVLNFHLGWIVIRNDTLHSLVKRNEKYFLFICNKLHSNAILAIFISRFIAVLLYMVPLVAGMLYLRPIKVYCITAFSAAVWSALYISGSHIFYNYYINS